MKKKRILGVFLSLFLISLIKAQVDEEKAEKKNHNFSLGGYARTGFGISQGGKAQMPFKAPYISQKYRLGNEADHYLEAQVSYEYLLPSNTSFEFVFMGAFHRPFGELKPFFIDNIPQLYVKLNKLYGNISLWGGKRYYQKQDYHIIDYAWMDPSEGAIGVGVEGLLEKKYQEDIKLALFKHENPLKTHKKQTVDTYSLDGRWVNIPINKEGKLNLWVNYSLRVPFKQEALERRQGMGVGFWHHQNIWEERIKNTLSFLYKRGSSTQNGIIEYSLEDKDMMENNLDGAYSIFFSDNLLLECTKKFALEALMLYRLQHHGMKPYHLSKPLDKAKGDKLHWFSMGSRFLYYIDKHFNLALEIGGDYINNQAKVGKTVEGWIKKITFSPQFTWDYGYFSRPLIRPFITYAFWDKSMMGEVASIPGSPYINKTKGFSLGIQAEIWW